MLVARGFQGRVCGSTFLFLEVSRAGRCIKPASILSEDSLYLHPDTLGYVNFDVVDCNRESSVAGVIEGLRLHVLLVAADFEPDSRRY